MTVADVIAELRDVFNELVVNSGLASPSPLTSPLCVKEPNEAGRFGGSVNPPKLRGLYSSPGGYKKGSDDEGKEVVVLMLPEVALEEAGVLLRDELLDSLSPRFFSESL